MEITEEQYETLHTIFPDHAIDVFQGGNKLTIVVWGNEND